MKPSKETTRKPAKAETKHPTKMRPDAKQTNDRIASRHKKTNNTSQTAVDVATRNGTSADLEPARAIPVYPAFPRTDAGNAELFARGFAKILRFDHRRGHWLVWRGHWWARDENELVLQAAKKIARYRQQYSATINDNEIAELEENWAIRSESRSRLEAMLKLAQSEHPLSDPGTDWDADPWLLGLANGVVDLRTGLLRPGKQADKITMHTDVLFDPTAKAPRWEQFLNEIFGGNQELIDYVQRAVGYSLTGDVSEQVIFLAYGTGANGKSTFLEVLRHVFGVYAYNLPFSAFELKARSAIPNEIAALSGKRFVTAIETNESAELNEGRIKALTGSDPITARFLYHEYFTFIPTSKYWLAFNHKPKVSDDSPGFWRRVRLIPFLQRFAANQADPDLLDRLKAEAPGIFNWAVAGALKWQKDGLLTAAIVVEASESYREESDLLKEFIDDRLVVDSSARVAAADLWKEYVAWAASNHERPLDRKTFAQKMQMRGFTKVRLGHDRIWTWLGLGLKRNIPVADPIIDLIDSAGGCGRQNANCS